jgi:transcriptional regulator of acetoin/glycerol metabolism
MATKAKTPQLEALIAKDPDLVDRVFEYLLSECPEFLRHVTGDRIEEAKQAVRDEFAGQEVYIAARPAGSGEELAFEVLSLFNGRNATEVGRRLDISRATVYRKLKQARRLKAAGVVKKPSQLSGK